jgi:iron uptake system component EfeO
MTFNFDKEWKMSTRSRVARAVRFVAPPLSSAVLVLVAACSSGGSGSSGATPVTPVPTATPDGGGTPVPEAGPPALTDAEQRAKAVQAMHDALLIDVQTLSQAVSDLKDAAPTPVGRGWDKTLDAAAITSMRAAWVRARTAYEHIEGALAPLFPDIDTSIDARYDNFLTNLGAAGDAYLFDDQGVVGMHAVERVLYADVIPARVVTFEMSLQGYVAAAMPATALEAADFKNKLCARLVADTKTLLGEWTPAKIDVAIAYAGLVSLVQEQREKVVKASTSEEESRYSQRTMTDLRDNLAGTKTAYGIFQPWLLSKTNGGADLDRDILAGFGRLDAAYGLVQGEAIPAPPATWSAEAPSAADLMTPFGQLYASVTAQVDRTKTDSVVSKLDTAGTLLGFAVPGK